MSATNINIYLQPFINGIYKYSIANFYLSGIFIYKTLSLQINDK